jgi:hypothetical protein
MWHISPTPDNLVVFHDGTLPADTTAPCSPRFALLQASQRYGYPLKNRFKLPLARCAGVCQPAVSS